MQPLVDLHCHLDLYPDHEAAIAECERSGVFTLTVTTTPKAWPRNEQMTSSTQYVRAALGLHPQLVADRGEEIGLWEQYLSRTTFVGEVGLDAGPRFYRSLDAQKQVFERVLRACARQGGKVLTVHSVRAVKAVLDMIEEHLPPPRGRVVLHWFTGSKAEARRAVELGCYFSINSEMMRTDRHEELLKSLPRDRLLTETDGPFTRTGGRTTRPSDVVLVVESLARLLGLSPDATSQLVHANLGAVVGEDASWKIRTIREDAR